ncbi:N-acetyltransferase, partial [Halorubrum sp. SS7]
MDDLQRNAPASTVTNVELGPRSTVSERATVGYEYAEGAGATVLGADATVRSGSI